MNEENTWDELLRAAVALQTRVPGAVLVGGSAAVMYAGHRRSGDADHVVKDLQKNYAQVLSELEKDPTWKGRRAVHNTMLLGTLEGVPTGVRRLRRDRELEWTTVKVGAADLAIPTIEEILRIKATLTVERNYVRDYVDVAALAVQMGVDRATTVLRHIEEYYPQPEKGILVRQLIQQLGDIRPVTNKASIEADLQGLRDLAPQWQDWNRTRQVCRGISASLVAVVAAEQTATIGLHAGGRRRR